MASQSYPEIILFWYDISIYSRKMDYYLTLRGLPYKRCIQPPNMPRPDLAQLGVKYRRIPILAIGRDVYCDTRIIIRKLEELFPVGALGSNTPLEQGLEQVIESWISDAGPFWRTAGCIPLSTPVVNDPVWMKDRFDGTGGLFTADMLQKGKPECLAHLRMYYGIAEKMLADGRKYIFNTEKPTLGDVHGIWTFDWGINLGLHAAQENVDDKVINAKEFPKVFAWVERFREVYRLASEKQHAGTFISSEQTIKTITSSDFFEEPGPVDESDPLGLRQGQNVDICVKDFGSTHIDRGELISLSTWEAVISSKTPGGVDLHLHFPRGNFTITAS